MEASPRFTSFADTYRDKIRKKIRLTRTQENVLDLHSELEVAYCLLNDRRLVLAYEPYASTKRRSPDFAVTYRTNLVFNIEVARLRLEENSASDLVRKKEERILRILLDKLEQMQAGMANLLVLHTPDELARTIDLDRLMQDIKTRVERKDASLYVASRYTSPAAFYRDFLHLSGLLLWAPGSKVWVNKQARPGLDDKVIRLVCALASSSSPTGDKPAP